MYENKRITCPDTNNLLCSYKVQKSAIFLLFFCSLEDSINDLKLFQGFQEKVFFFFALWLILLLT